jgi:hypothetical protein
MSIPYNVSRFSARMSGVLDLTSLVTSTAAFTALDDRQSAIPHANIHLRAFSRVSTKNINFILGYLHDCDLRHRLSASLLR